MSSLIPMDRIVRIHYIKRGELKMKKIISLCLICSLMFAYGCASKAANGAGIGAIAGGAAGAAQRAPG